MEKYTDICKDFLIFTVRAILNDLQYNLKALWIQDHQGIFSLHNISAEKIMYVAVLQQCVCIYIYIFFFFSVLPVYCYQLFSLYPHACMLSHVTPWTAACQAPLSMDFSRQECIFLQLLYGEKYCAESVDLEEKNIYLNNLSFVHF